MNSLQQNDDWRMARCGKITASSMYKVLSSDKLATYQNYVAEIVAERVSNTPTESYQSSAMEWGIENEQLARFAYELQSGFSVQEVGFIQHESLMVGASPDGVIGEDGLIEIKCPNTATHLDTLLRGTIDPKYYAQMQCQMWITDRLWCDFVSYDPRLIGKAQMFIKRVERDSKFIFDMQDKCMEFLKKVDEMVRLIDAINN